MTSKVFYQMYGTKYHFINEDGVIVSYINDVKHLIADPFHDHLNGRAQITINEPNRDPITLSIAQFLLYTMYGYSNSPIVFRDEHDYPSMQNCVMIPQIASLSNDECVLQNGEVFKFICESKMTSTRWFVNRFGAVLEISISIDGIRTKFIRWSYDASYAFFKMGPRVRDGATALNAKQYAIHRLVFAKFGDVDISDFKGLEMDVHHKDGCRWNNCIDNLELLTHTDHLAVHAREKAASAGFGDKKIEKAFEMLSKDAYIDDIVFMLTDGNNDRSNAARCLINTIMRKRTSYPEFRQKYDVSKYQKNKGVHYDEAVIRMVFDMLSSDIPYSDLEIARKTGISGSMVRFIRLGKTNNAVVKKIAKEYKGRVHQEARQNGYFKPILTKEQALEVRKLCKCSNLINSEIGKLFNCSDEVIRGIRNGKSIAFIDLFRDKVESDFTERERKYKSKIIINDPELAAKYADKIKALLS